MNKCLFAPDRVPRHTKEMIPSKSRLENQGIIRVTSKYTREALLTGAWVINNQPHHQKGHTPMDEDSQKVLPGAPCPTCRWLLQRKPPLPNSVCCFYRPEEGRCESCHLLILQSLLSSSRREWSNREQAATLPNPPLILGLM